MPTKIKVGFPKLPEPESGPFYRIMQFWIKDCENRLGCGGLSYNVSTRLVDVGTLDTTELRLVRTEKEHPLPRATSASSTTGIN